MHWNIHLLLHFACFLRYNSTNAMWQEAAEKYARIAEAGSESEVVEAVNNLTAGIGRAITPYVPR